MHTKQMTITPDLAKQFLTQNTNNRNVRNSVVKRYSADMLSGKFLLMPHGIVFLEDGTLADGQHRLLAIVASQTTQQMMVTFDAPPEIHLFQDRLAVRSEHDCLKMAGFDWSNKDIVAVLKLITATKSGQRYVSTSDILECSEKEGVLFSINLVEKVFSTKKKGLSTAPVRAALVLAIVHKKSGYQKVDDFVQVLLSGHGQGDLDSAAITLRNKLITSPELGGTGSTAREHVLKLTQSCFSAFLDGKTIKRVPKHDELIWAKLPNGAN